MQKMEDIRHTLETALSALKDVAEAVVTKSKETAEVVKLRLEISAKKRKMLEEMTNIGMRVYSLAKEDKLEEVSRDNEILERIKSIDELNRELESLEDQLEREKGKS